MAFLNTQVITVDAVLTKKGRELLARGDGSFNITQFALSDDEVDYTLYNPNHPSGSAFAGEAIEKQPLTEAFTDETQVMKYKLFTAPRGTSRLPVINIGFNAITLRQGATITITPQTLNYLGARTSFEPSGYLMTISDVRLLSVFSGIGVDAQLPSSEVNSTFGTNLSQSQLGTSFTLTGTTLNTLFGNLPSLQTSITVIGRDSGARVNIPLTITKTN